MSDLVVANVVDNFMQSTSQSEMRSSLALGTAATANTGTGTSNVITGNDSRLTNARTPTSHAASHLTGSDQISEATPSSKGLMSAADKTKLDSLDGSGGGGSEYVLPVATTTEIGGVKRNEGSEGQFVSGIDESGNLTYSTPAGGGDVSGPSSSTDNRLVAFDGTSGKLLKDSGVQASSFVGTSREVATGGSLTGGGDLSANRSLALVNDNASPGNSKFYGTDGSGTKGFHDLPSGASSKNSIEEDAGALQLVGDSSSPGNSKYYGTSSSGTKGFHDIPTAFPGTLTESSTTRSLSLSDAGKYIRCTHASGCTVTVFQQSTISWPVDTEIYFRRAGGAVSLSEGSGVTINNRSAAADVPPHGTFAIKRVAENVWDFI